jgi:hypothetical protein
MLSDIPGLISLDITERIIAMGFPAEKFESVFRNSMSDVKQYLSSSFVSRNRFFNTRHPNHYRIYNLCAEKKYQYDVAHFNGNVGLYQSYDHQAPPLTNMFAFCEDVV